MPTRVCARWLPTFQQELAPHERHLAVVLRACLTTGSACAGARRRAQREV